jgi:hypothetical protein
MPFIAAGKAFAFQSDLFEGADLVKFEADSEYSLNSNLFMLPSGVNPSALNSDRGDAILTSRVGIKVSQDIGMQHLDLSYSHANAKYKNASFLDYDTDNYSASWLWSLTPALKGDLFARRTVLPRSAEVYGRNAPTSGKQLSADEVFGILFDFSPHQIVHVYGGYMNHDIRTTGQVGADYSQSWDELSAGLGYEFKSGTLIKLMYLDKKGAQTGDDVSAIGEHFNGDETRLTMLWPISGNATMNASIGYVDRNDSTYLQRNYSGLVGGIKLQKDLHGQHKLAISYDRRLSLFQTNTISHVEVNEISVSDTWAMTAKLTIKASVIADQQQFVNVNQLDSPARSDDNLRYGIDATWQSSEKIKLRALLQRTQRHSNEAEYVCNNNLASVYAEIKF